MQLMKVNNNNNKMNECDPSSYNVRHRKCNHSLSGHCSVVISICRFYNKIVMATIKRNGFYKLISLHVCQSEWMNSVPFFRILNFPFGSHSFFIVGNRMKNRRSPNSMPFDVFDIEINSVLFTWLEWNSIFYSRAGVDVQLRKHQRWRLHLVNNNNARLLDFRMWLIEKIHDHRLQSNGAHFSGFKIQMLPDINSSRMNWALSNEHRMLFGLRGV